MNSETVHDDLQKAFAAAPAEPAAADADADLPAGLIDALVNSAVATLTPDLGNAADAKEGGGSSTFRKRRLTVTAHTGGQSGGATLASLTDGKAAPKKKSTAPPVIPRRMFVAHEIGEVPASEPLFSTKQVGTYSCHGIEPSYYEADGITAKINQDRGVVCTPIDDQAHSSVFAVYDGHGERGEKVSDFVMRRVIDQLGCFPNLKGQEPAALINAFVTTNDMLSAEPDVEPMFSGTTAVCVLMRENHIWCANCGDSRAVIGTLAGKKIKARDVSHDQNPDTPGEKERIVRSGGFVSPPPEPGLSARVWLDEGMKQVGLAMARSIGDHAVKHIGVIAAPAITEDDVVEGDQFMILASDGVWEFISSQEACDAVFEKLNSGAGAAQAAQLLIEMAALRWREMEGEYRDDITVVLVRFPGLWEDGDAHAAK